MPVAKIPGLPMINAGQALYGEMPIGLLPAGDAADQTSNFHQFAYWDGVQWHITKVVGTGGIDITYDAVNNVLEFYFGEGRTYGGFTADSIILAAPEGDLTADAELV